jgi:hypothetical protein
VIRHPFRYRPHVRGPRQTLQEYPILR